MRFSLSLGMLILTVFSGASSLWARGRRPEIETKPKFSAWAAYWDGARGRQALDANASRLEEVELFAYHFAADGTLVPAHANMKDLLEAFRRLPGQKPRLAITLVNDLEGPGGIQLKDPACVHRALATPAARDAHIRQILAIAGDAESIDVDYERVALEDGPAFTTFIQALAAELHYKGKRLSVVVEPRVSDESAADPLSNGSHALSWPDIAEAADQLTVMAYLYHYGASAPGSIAPVEWVSQVAAYALSNVPEEKLSIALHVGGFDWSQGGPGRSLEYDKAEALAAAYGASIQLDQKTQSGYFAYSDGSSAHEVWVETAAGLRAKIDALADADIRHIALWRLGAGDPAFWGKLPER
jgi:spore germination protein YaaH